MTESPRQPDKRWALDSLGDELARVEPSAERAGRILARPGVRYGIAAATLALIGFVSLTPPGRALAEELAELVGIGEPASLPPQDLGPHVTNRGQPVVIASGFAPDGARYELVANRSVVQPPEERVVPVGAAESAGDPDGPVTCATVDMPDTPELGAVEVCISAHDTEFLSGHRFGAVNFSDRALEPGEGAELAGSPARYVVSSELPPVIETVEVTYRDETGAVRIAPSDIGYVDDEIAAIIGGDTQFGYMVAFLPDDGQPTASSTKTGPGPRREAGILGTVELVGYDESGQIVARDDFGRRVADSYESMEQRRLAQTEALKSVEAAQARDGLALTRENVRICEEAMGAIWPGFGDRSRGEAAEEACRKLIDEAAERGLYGWSTGASAAGG